MLYQGYIINPDSYLLPYYKLTPFKNKDIYINRSFPNSELSDIFFKQRHPEFILTYTSNGRMALNLALKNLCLVKKDLVSILTTTQNFYISGCVTNEIEKFCKWNREINDQTTVILINHEFGFPHPEVLAIKKYNLPIIEDCAYSFNSQDKENLTGKVGDFVIYSFPKFFPIQIGGLLVSKDKISLKEEVNESKFVKTVVSNYINFINHFSKIRIYNYNYLKNALNKIGLNSRFGDLLAGTVPGAFMLELPEDFNASLLKEYMYKNGVECSVFYGENTLFIPCHNDLTVQDLDYFVALLSYYINHK